MRPLNKLIKDSKTIPQTFRYKYIFNQSSITIEDQEEALTRSDWSYCFAKENIPGSDFKALQAKACEDSCWAYYFALNIPSADIKYCQEYACKDPYYAYHFAKDIPGADIKYCQEHACKDPYYACLFMEQVRNIAGKLVKEHNGSFKQAS